MNDSADDHNVMGHFLENDGSGAVVGSLVVKDGGAEAMIAGLVDDPPATDGFVRIINGTDDSASNVIVSDMSGESINPDDRSLQNINSVDLSNKNANDTDLSPLGTTVVDGVVKSTCSSDGPVKSSAIMDSSVSRAAADNSELVPKVGMVFHSEEEAYNFYNLYAKRKGFSVRKGHLSRRRDNSVRDRHYVCSNEGSRQEHRTHVTKKPRPLERTNCLARIEFKVNRSNVWVVHKFVDDHNHQLAGPNGIHLLRSHRKKCAVERAIFTESDYYYGVKPALPHENPAEEMNGIRDVGLLMKNETSCLSARRLRDLEKGDAQFLLDFLKTKQSEDPSFFYAVQLDEKERLTNFFWADGRSITEYAYFGDAVAFDTSYRTSRFDIPIAPFFGVNNHKQVTVFAAALLLDETAETFIWLFKTFLAAMHGRQPKTISTDRCHAIAKAINMILPNTSHRFCLWHILQDVPKNVLTVSSREPNFQKDFEGCIFGVASEEDFCKSWDNLISKHGLGSSSWLNELFAVREKWALPYLCNSFVANMITKQWVECMENLFKIHFYRKLPLPKFITHYFKSLAQLREKELIEDYESRQSKRALLVDIPMLAEAAESYTRSVYMDFEYEYKSQLACICEPIAMDGTACTFKVSVPQKRSSGLVEFNPSNTTVTCSCKKFEATGVLCMHALKALNNNNILYLPAQYIIQRWTKYAKDGAMPTASQAAAASSSKDAISSQYSRVCHKAVHVAIKSSISKDALDILEHGLDRFISEMENMFHGAPWSKQTVTVDVVANMQHNLEASSICFDGFDFATR